MWDVKMNAREMMERLAEDFLLTMWDVKLDMFKLMRY